MRAGEETGTNGNKRRRTLQGGQALDQLADLHVQSVVSHRQLVDRLVHPGESGH